MNLISLAGARLNSFPASKMAWIVSLPYPLEQVTMIACLVPVPAQCHNLTGNMGTLFLDKLGGISLPQLKNRKEDIPLLIEYFLNKYRHMPGQKNLETH